MCVPVLGFLFHVARQAGVVVSTPVRTIRAAGTPGGAVNLNVHVHALVLDGVFAPDRAGVRFHPARPLTAADVADVLATVEPRVRRLLERRGFGDSDESGGAGRVGKGRARAGGGLPRRRCRA